MSTEIQNNPTFIVNLDGTLADAREEYFTPYKRRVFEGKPVYPNLNAIYNAFQPIQDAQEGVRDLAKQFRFGGYWTARYPALLSTTQFWLERNNFPEPTNVHLAKLETAGYFGVFAIVLAQSGILLGFFLPGNTFLITAGFLASLGIFNIHLLVFICFLASFSGNIVGYFIGHRWGRRLFSKEGSLLFNKKYLYHAEEFYEIHGGKTIILARFVNVMRTFAPVVSGIGRMKYSSFLLYNLSGAAIWTGGLLHGGYYLGQSFADANKYILIAAYLLVVIIIYPRVYRNFKIKQSKKVKK